MYKTLSLVPILCFSLLVNIAMAQDSTKTDSVKKVTEKPPSAATIIKDFSYSYGYSLAQDLYEKSNFKPEEMIDREILKGIKAGLKVDSAGLAATNKHLEERFEQDSSVVITAAMGKKTAYHIGVNAVANVIKLLELPASDFHYGFVKKGYIDYAKKKKPKFEEKEMEEKLRAYFQAKQIEMQERILEERKEEGRKNLEKGEKFLAENAKKEGIKTTASGLQYQVIKEGTGEKPTLESNVVTHYTGTFMNGKVFDSSIERGKPAQFALKNVIKGWQEGLQLMTVGSRYRLFVPAALAYGENGPASIPVNSVLIFDVELLEIVKVDPSASAAKAKMSYAYGYMIAKSLKQLNLTEQEQDPVQFVQGFSKGFDATPQDIQTIEMLLKLRLDKGEPTKDEEDAKKIAFGIGYSSAAGIATQLGCKLVDFDYNGLGAGYSTALKGEDSQMEDEEMNMALKAYFEPKQREAQAAVQKQQQLMAEANIEAGKRFMAENAKKEGVVTMDNGMQYIVIKEGEGAQAKLTDKVTTHYHGTLINGTVFDSSVDRGEPATFPLQGVIKGWQEGIPLMKVGAKYKFFIPQELAYGLQSPSPTIPPGSLLIFEVELIKIGE